jgi:subtilisin family serine protease
MTRRNIVFWTVLLLLVTCLVVVLYRAKHDPQNGGKRGLAKHQAGHEDDGKALGPADAKSIAWMKSGATQSARDAAGAETLDEKADGPSGPTDSNIIPDEHVLRFYNRADQEAFLRLAEKLGATILGKMRFGNAIRIRVEDAELLKRLLEEGPVAIDHSPNYFVRLPDPSELEKRNATRRYTPVGDGLLDWLGEGVDNSDWGYGVTVAVLDTAFGYHRGIPENRIMRMNPFGISSEGTYGGHGLSVTSLIIGDPGYAAGIAPRASVVSIPVMNGDGVGNSFILAQGIEHAMSMNVDIINLSLGSPGDSSLSLGSPGDSGLLRDLINDAYGKGIPIVAATGNDGVESVAFPARYSPVIAVAAVDGENELVHFPNYGPQTDIAAPGVGIQAVGEDGPIYFSGTSAATPLVSGAIAAVMSENDVSAHEAVQLLMEYADDTGAPGTDEDVGSGVISVTRVEKRNEPGIYDMRAHRVYIDQDQISEDELTVSLYAQNRGTEDLEDVKLIVETPVESFEVMFDHVAVGQTIFHELTLSADDFEDTGSVVINHGATYAGKRDATPRNNGVSSIIDFSFFPKAE